jgi:hypothetical protein
MADLKWEEVKLPAGEGASLCGDMLGDRTQDEYNYDGV